MYRRYPDFDEGKLTDLRKIVVNMNALSRVATQLGLGEFILLGRGEEAGGGREKTSILANALEAVFAAVYLDSDALSAYALVRSLLSESIDEALAALKQLDAKSQLQELCSRLDNPMPEYRVTDEGPDHAKTFYAAVYIGNDWMGAGSGRSKKVAEELAAQQAFATLQDS
jgi:ribonuclease-3